METAVQTCHWHPDQPAGVICQRCDRPICPRCMHQASVGFHCPNCAKAGRQKVVRGLPVTKPIMTMVLIVINVAAFVIGVVVDGTGSIMGDMGRMQIDYGLFAKGGTPYDGALHGVGAGEWYRMVTTGFLHYGLLHLAMNMWALWILGNAVEAGVGRVRMAALYGASLLAGSLGALIVSPGSLTVGASGAIFGLMGAIFMAHRAQGISFRDSPLLNVLIINLVITFAFASYISVGGHLGGLVGGAVAGWIVFDLGRRRSVPSWVPVAGCIALGAACLVAGMVVANAYTLT